jgi:intein/homing endonuclease
MEIYSKAVMSGGCVVAGTKMIMSNGNHKNIEDVKEGEMVKTLFGDKTIKHTWTPETLEDGEPECFEVKFEDGSTVTCSENHMFLIDNVWTKVKDLCVGVDLIEISSQNT